MANKFLVSVPTIRYSGFNLRHSTWSMLTRFQTCQVRCVANLLKRRRTIGSIALSYWCQCGDIQTMVESCPV